MINEFKCKNCDCTTTHIELKIDEKIKVINNNNETDYILAMGKYLKKVREITKYFNELIKEHNDNIRWYNFKIKWILSDNGCCFKIKEKGNWFEQTIKEEIIFLPFLYQKPYKYIECPICNHRKYID